MALTGMPTATIKLYWTDKSGSVAISTFHVPVSLSYEQAYSRANALANAMKAISTAVLSRIVVLYRHVEDDLVLPEAVSSAQTAWGLFYRNGDTHYAIYIPAPNLALAESEGIYAQVRLDISQPYVLTSVQNLTLALGQTTTADGTPTQLQYRAGGLAV